MAFAPVRTARRGVPVLLALASWSPAALGDPLTPAERVAIDERLESTRPAKGKITVAQGDTVFIERTAQVKASRIRGKKLDYEGLVTGIVAPEGVVVHPRVDRFSLERQGAVVEVRFRYALHVDPGPTNGGRVRLTLNLVERKGLANVILAKKVTHWVKAAPPQATPRDLAADFRGYRLYRQQAEKKRRALARAGIRVSMQALARLPTLSRADGRVVKVAYDFTRDRRRMWIAHRHLVAASQGSDPRAAEHARIYLSNLDKPAAQVSGLPDVALVDEAAAPPPPAEAPEAVEPVAERPSGPPPTTEDGTLAPVATYEPGSESEPLRDLPPARPRPEKTEEPEAPEKAAAPDQPQDGPAQDDEDDVALVRSDDPFETYVRRLKKIPSYPRPLTLDDPNIAHGGGFRMTWANATVRGTSATTPAFYFFGQASITRFIGLELTVPTEFVNADLEGARSVYALGNPLLALKWRLFLPKVEERRPALTLRARWGIPLSPQNNIPPTTFGAEDFSREAHFADTYAFFLERSPVGLGASFTWQWKILFAQAQFYTDYYIPVSGDDDFFALSYGASVGVLPLDDMLGVYAEARAVSLLVGPGRTEFFTYLGARGRFADYIQPAVWVGLPLGSILESSGVQIGAEIRFSYDVYDVVDPGGSGRRERDLLE